MVTPQKRALVFLTRAPYLLKKRGAVFGLKITMCRELGPSRVLRNCEGSRGEGPYLVLEVGVGEAVAEDGDVGVHVHTGDGRDARPDGAQVATRPGGAMVELQGHDNVGGG